MVSNIDIDKIKEIEKEQKLLNKQIPFKVKYQKDYLWQIYYSEYTNKYFMLVPTEDLEQGAFFYVLKKQLQNKKEKIFVPISYMDYTREYLTRMQISDIENYLWLFTKEWPIIYQVYNKKEEISIHIVGKAVVFDDIKSDYKIELKNNEAALKFYKLIKALFIMQTEIPHHFEFNASIDKKGSLEFNINNKKVAYSILTSFIKEEYLKAEEKRMKIIDRKGELEKELDKLQKEATKLEREYLDKEKQIAIFLEYKKTFFGRVKYFFKYKKVFLTKKEDKEENKQDIKVIRINKYGEVRSNYTLEELIEMYKQIDKEEFKEKNLQLDIKAINDRITNLKNKVKNASLYIEEIDKHKKSIFEFWKFTNKDKIQELPEGETGEIEKVRIKKTFDYEMDFEDFAKDLDRKQRENLTKQELDSLYITTTSILEDINKRSEGQEINEERLEYLKEQALKEQELFDNETFDIFRGMSYENKLKNLANQKHRETKKELFDILPITKHTESKEYNEIIQSIISNLELAIKKIKVNMPIPVYKCVEEENLENNYNIFNLQALAEIEPVLKQDTDIIYLYKINLNEDTNVLAYTNSAFFENTNKTLPLGMDVKQAVLLKTSDLHLKEIEKNKVNVVCFEDENNDLSPAIIKQINVKEYVISN